MLSFLGLVIIFVSTYQVYKTAKGTGRNGIGWGVLTFITGFGLQLVFPFTIGFIIGFSMIANGKSQLDIEKQIQSVDIFITIFGLIVSIIGISIIMRQVAKIPEGKSFNAPPPPPNFRGE